MKAERAGSFEEEELVNCGLRRNEESLFGKKTAFPLRGDEKWVVTVAERCDKKVTTSCL